MQNEITNPDATHVKHMVIRITIAVISLDVKYVEDYSTEKYIKDCSLPAICKRCTGTASCRYNDCTVYKKLTESIKKRKKAELQTQHFLLTSLSIQYIYLHEFPGMPAQQPLNQHPILPMQCLEL